jgi:hypothetical protein
MAIGEASVSRLALTGVVAALAFAAPAQGADQAELARDLNVTVDGVEKTLNLE